MSANVEYSGLCSTCQNSSDCTLPRDAHKPVFYCEQFEIERPAPIRTAGKIRSPMADSRSASEAVEAEEATSFFGLCRDCECRNTCVFPKFEGGIWHCEEYQ